MVWPPAERVSPRQGSNFVPEKWEKNHLLRLPEPFCGTNKKGSGAPLPRSKKKEEKGEMK